MCFFRFAQTHKGKGRFYFQPEHKQNANLWTRNAIIDATHRSYATQTAQRKQRAQRNAQHRSATHSSATHSSATPHNTKPSHIFRLAKYQRGGRGRAEALVAVSVRERKQFLFF